MDYIYNRPCEFVQFYVDFFFHASLLGIRMRCACVCACVCAFVEFYWRDFNLAAGEWRLQAKSEKCHLNIWEIEWFVCALVVLILDLLVSSHHRSHHLFQSYFDFILLRLHANLLNQVNKKGNKTKIRLGIQKNMRNERANEYSNMWFDVRRIKPCKCSILWQFICI